ncbi:MAG: DUF4418 family protein [Firmicutes bacterium]|nr:DUF4418 family protein [Bacillota bacterium]
MNKKISVTDIMIVLLSVILAAGIPFFFHACGAKEDGTFMNCHSAQQVIFGLACVMMIISFAHLGAGSAKMKTGISIALIPLEIYTALIPETVIKMCMMADMRCQAVMKPATIIICILMLIVTISDIVYQKKRGNINDEKADV